MIPEPDCPDGQGFVVVCAGSTTQLPTHDRLVSVQTPHTGLPVAAGHDDVLCSVIVPDCPEGHGVDVRVCVASGTQFAAHDRLVSTQPPHTGLPVADGHDDVL